MKILEELKLALIEVISQAQMQTKKASTQLNDFIKISTEALADAENAAELAQTIRNIIDQHLSAQWFKPWWYLSVEHRLREDLLNILNQPSYSLLNLLIRTNKEDRQLIHELENERLHYHAHLNSQGLTPDLIAHYDHKIKSYSERYDLDQRRIAQLSAASYELIDENTHLSEQNAMATKLLAKLATGPGFAKLTDDLDLTSSEHELLVSYLISAAGSEAFAGSNRLDEQILLPCPTTI
ncbi:MAG TPA: hypothetical protein VD770_01185 [Coxiellaceae bacterium]|nr:hypothetical protein [Coxiellaceae bacterium]